MFGLNKKKEKKETSLDKVLMGLVVGGAIGSVLGVGLAPKKGSEIRKDISKQTGQVYKKAKGSLFGVIGKYFKSNSTKSLPQHNQAGNKPSFRHGEKHSTGEK